MGLRWIGSLAVSHDGILYALFLVESLLNPSYGSFYGYSDVPPKGALLGGPIEEAGCGA